MRPVTYQNPSIALRKFLVSTDVDVQAIRLIAATTFLRRNVRLAVIERVTGWTGVHDLDNNATVDDVIGSVAIKTEVIDTIACTALYRCWGTAWSHVGGWWVLTLVCCAYAHVVFVAHIRRASVAKTAR